MASFVLVHGAWTGGWIWQDVARRLRQAGHEVYTPTLTGLGERAHLGRPGVGLDTHITDIINVLSYEDLQDVILVGHSYSGSVVQGVADRVPERLSGLIYTDCAPSHDGVAIFDFFSEEGRAATEREVEEIGDGWKMPMPSIEELGQIASIAGLDDATLSIMEERGTAQPIDTFRQPISLTREYGGEYPRHLIACSEGDFSVQGIKDGIASGEPFFQPIADPDWTFHEIPTGHWPMLSTPAELAEVLDIIARDVSGRANAG